MNRSHLKLNNSFYIVISKFLRNFKKCLRFKIANFKKKSKSKIFTEILKKFNEERKARQLAEEKTLDLEKNIKILNSDNKYLKEDINKKEKEFNDEIIRFIAIKKELDLELNKKCQEANDLNTDLSNSKILEKHLNKMLSDLKEENLNLKEECDRLRKISLESENMKIKKLQEEIEELKTMNQLYRSQRLENNEEIENLGRERDKIKRDNLQLGEELFVKFF